MAKKTSLSSTQTALIALAIIFFLGLAFLMGSYNHLVQLQTEYQSQWAQVENQYQRRFDLIPNLVSATQGQLEQERIVFTALAEARSRYAGAGSQAEQVEAAGQVESALSRLLVIVENYPQLASSDVIMGLMDELAGTENRVSVERQRYNEAVRDYNRYRRQAPTIWVASTLGFEEAGLFMVPETVEAAPSVDLSLE